MLAAVQTVQTKSAGSANKSAGSVNKSADSANKSADSADKVQTKCTFVYTRKMIDYQHFKTKSAECRQNSKNYVEEV